MKHSATSITTLSRRLKIGVIASALVSALALTPLTLQAQAVDKSPVDEPVVAHTKAAQGGDAFNYYSDIANLPANHVFKNTTIELFQNILRQKTGKYVFLIGGTWDENVQQALPVINAEAQKLGIKQIYNFDTHLDNVKNSIVDVNAKPKNSFQPGQFSQNIASLFNDGYLSANLLAQTSTRSSDRYFALPTLFVYDAGKEGTNGRDIASTKALPTDAHYADEVKRVLSTAGADAATYADGQFWVDRFDERHKLKETSTPDIFDKGSANNIAFVPVTYGEFLKILQSKGDYYLLLAGTWCPNSEGVVRYINDEAVKHGVKNIYVLDTVLDGISKQSIFHIRDSISDTRPLANLYVNLVNTYLKNVRVEDQNKRIEGSSDRATRIQVPFLFHYNKDNTKSFNNILPAGPVTDEFVIYKDPTNAQVKEIMVYWAGTYSGDTIPAAPRFNVLSSYYSPQYNYGTQVNSDRELVQLHAKHFFDTITTRLNAADVTTTEPKTGEPTSVQPKTTTQPTGQRKTAEPNTGQRITTRPTTSQPTITEPKATQLKTTPQPTTALTNKELNKPTDNNVQQPPVRAVQVSDLTQDNHKQDLLTTAQAQVTANAELTLHVGAEQAGQEVDVYVFSTPVYLGRFRVNNDGTIKVPLSKAKLESGNHRTAVSLPDGKVVWANFTVRDDLNENKQPVPSLPVRRHPSTGVNVLPFALAASVCIVAGVAYGLVRRLYVH